MALQKAKEYRNISASREKPDKVPPHDEAKLCEACQPRLSSRKAKVRRRKVKITDIRLRGKPRSVT